MIELLRDRLSEPTSRGLADAVSHAIRDGVIADGEHLPPIRTVASGLRLSPTTVSAAWGLLARAGAIRTDGRRGTTVVAPGSIGPARYRRALGGDTTFPLDLSTGVPDPLLLPDLGPTLQQLRPSVESVSYLDRAVLPALEEALRADWPYAAERLTVVDGAMDAIDQVASTVLRYGDTVAVEHPSFPPLLDLLDALGVRAIGVAMDDDGMLPQELAAALDRGVTAVFLQPRAQNPTGASLSESRLAELAAVLEGSTVLVVEDDSAGAVAAAPTLSLGRLLPDRTVHVRSFSKSHGPDLRLAAVSGPARVMDAVTERRLLGQGWTSRLLQSVLLDLLTRPDAVAQVSDARATYARRRQALVTALAARGVEVGGRDGLNVWLPVRDEVAALLRLASRGIGAAAGSPFNVKADATAHLRVTAGLVAEDVERVAAELADAAAVGSWSSPR